MARGSARQELGRGGGGTGQDSGRVGWLASSQGDLERAQAAANEGLKLSTEAGLGKVIVADFQNVLGDTARHRGDYEAGGGLLEKSLALHRAVKDTRGVALSLGDLANVAGDRGDHELAKELYEEGLALAKDLGGAELLGAYLISLGEYLLEGNPERATELNEEAANCIGGGDARCSPGCSQQPGMVGADQG